MVHMLSQHYAPELAQLVPASAAASGLASVAMRSSLTLPSAHAAAGDVDKTHRSYTSLKSKASSMAITTKTTSTTPVTSPMAKPHPKTNVNAPSTKQIKPTKRKTQPPEYNLKRGSKKAALAVAQDPQAFAEAERLYMKDWSSAGDTSNYYLITWLELHAAVGIAKGYGTWEAFPLTSERIHGVGTLLKAGGYRSTKTI